MADGIFREKSLERVNSPEKLDDYLKIANPTIWLVLIAIVIGCVGFVIWAYVGTIDYYDDCGGECKNGVLTIYVAEHEGSKIAENKVVYVPESDKYYDIDEISNTSVRIDDTFDPITVHKSELNTGDWCYIVKSNTDLADGIYDVKVLVDSVRPISYIIESDK